MPTSKPDNLERKSPRNSAMADALINANKKAGNAPIPSDRIATEIIQKGIYADLVMTTLSVLQVRHKTDWITLTDIVLEIIRMSGQWDNVTIPDYDKLSNRAHTALVNRKDGKKKEENQCVHRYDENIFVPFGSHPNLRSFKTTAAWHIGGPIAPPLKRNINDEVMRLLEANNNPLSPPATESFSDLFEESAKQNNLEVARVKDSPKPQVPTLRSHSQKDIEVHKTNGQSLLKILDQEDPASVIKQLMTLLKHEELIEVQLHALALMDEKHKNAQSRLLQAAANLQAAIY